MVPVTTKQLSNSWWITMNHHLLVFMIFPNMNPFLLQILANLPTFGHKSQINRSLRAARCLSFGSCCWDRLEEQLLGIASTLGSWALYGDWGAKAHTTIGGYMWDAFVFEILEHDWTMLVELCYLCWLNWTWWTELCWLNVKLFGQNGLNMIELCWYSWKVKTCRGGKTMPVLLANNVVNPISKHPQIYLKWFVLQSSKNRKNMLGFTTITYINEHVQIPFAPAATSSWLIHSPWVNFASARHSVDFPLPCKPRTKTAVSVSSSLSAAIALGNATCARARARASPQSDDH